MYSPYDPDELRRRNLLAPPDEGRAPDLQPQPQAVNEGPQYTPMQQALQPQAPQEPQPTQPTAPETPEQNFTPVDQGQRAQALAPPESDTIKPIQTQAGAKIQAMGPPPDPRAEEYKHGKLRTVLNAIVGGLVGASQGPEAGIKVGQALRYDKYNLAAQHFAEQMKQLDEQQKSEQSGYTIAAGAQKLKNQLTNYQSLGSSRAIQANAAQTRAQTGVAEQASKAERRIALNKYDTWKQQPENAKKTDFQYLMTLDDPDDLKAATALMKELHPHETTAEKVQATIDTKSTPDNLNKLGQVAAVTGGAGTTGRLHASTTPDALDRTRKLKEAQAEGATKGRLIVQGSDFGIKTAKSLAEARVAANNLALSANIKDTRAAALAGLEHLPRIYSQIDDMDQAGKLGPIMSKWSDFLAGKVGTDAESARLRFNVGLMDTLLAKAHGGARGGGSPAMLHHFQSLMSSKNMDANTLRATLQEAEMWLKTYAASGHSAPIDNKPTLGPVKFIEE